MGHFVLASLLGIQLISLSLGCSSSGGSSGGGGLNIPRSNSGRPFGYDINSRTEVYPNYDSTYRAVGVGLDYRPSDRTTISVSAGAEVGPLLGTGQVKPAGGISISTRFRRRREAKNATMDEEISRKLFQLFDLNQDGEIDAVEWFADGGKILEFGALVIDHDTNDDGEISLAEFIQVPVLHGIALHVTPPEPAEEPKED